MKILEKLPAVMSMSTIKSTPSLWIQSLEVPNWWNFIFRGQTRILHYKIVNYLEGMWIQLNINHITINCQLFSIISDFFQWSVAPTLDILQKPIWKNENIKENASALLPTIDSRFWSRGQRHLASRSRNQNWYDWISSKANLLLWLLRLLTESRRWTFWGKGMVIEYFANESRHSYDLNTLHEIGLLGYSDQVSQPSFEMSGSLGVCHVLKYEMCECMIWKWGEISNIGDSITEASFFGQLCLAAHSLCPWSQHALLWIINTQLSDKINW